MDNDSNITGVHQADYNPKFDIFKTIGVAGIFLNGVVLFVFIKSPNIVSRIPRVLIINQSLIDMVTAVAVIVAQYYSFIGESGRVMADTVLSVNPDLACRLLWSNYFMWALMSTSTLNMEVLTVERFLSVVYATWHRNSCSMSMVYGVTVLVWFLGFGVKFHEVAFDFSFIPPNICVPDIQDNTYGIVIGTFNFVWMWVLPVFIVCFCYGSIGYRLLRTEPVVSGAADRGTEQKNITEAQVKRNKKKAKSTRDLLTTCTLIGVAYVVCMTPNQVTWYQFQMGGHLDFDGIWYPATVTLAFINTCVNPLIYIFKLNIFRKEFERLFRGRAAVPDGVATGGSSI